jgi:uncharacterized protein (TIGR03000 family)
MTGGTVSNAPSTLRTTAGAARVSTRNGIVRPSGFGGGFGGVGFGGFGFGGAGFRAPGFPAGANFPGVFDVPDGGGFHVPPQQFFEPPIMVANEYPATLTIQLPTQSQMWLEGKPLLGEVAEEYTLTSPDLPQGEKFTFTVKVRWTASGKTFEANRVVKLAQGERGRLFIISGDEVKE